MANYTRCTNAKTTRKPNSRPNRKLLPENILSVLSPKSNPLLEHYSAAYGRESIQDIRSTLRVNLSAIYAFYQLCVSNPIGLIFVLTYVLEETEGEIIYCICHW